MSQKTYLRNNFLENTHSKFLQWFDQGLHVRLQDMTLDLQQEEVKYTELKTKELNKEILCCWIFYYDTLL